MSKQALKDRPVLYVAGGRASGFVALAIKAHADAIGARIVGRLDLPKSVRHAASLPPLRAA